MTTKPVSIFSQYWWLNAAVGRNNWDVILIKIAAQKNKTFDFEGSMHETIEPFFRSFNPVFKNYVNITKYNNRTLKFYKEIICH